MTGSPEATEPAVAPVRVTVIPLAVPAAGDFEPPVPNTVVAPSADAAGDARAAVEEPPGERPPGGGQFEQRRARRPLRDPWTYASVGTFIAVFAIVFDLLLVTLGTANTTLLTAGGIAAGFGLMLMIASGLTLRRRAPGSTGGPA